MATRARRSSAATTHVFSASRLRAMRNGCVPTRRTPPKRREVCQAQHGPRSGPNPPLRSLALTRHHRRASIGIAAVYSAAYCASLTCSSQVTGAPSCDSAMAICVIATLALAPCQCLTPGGIHTISPGRICCAGLPPSCTRPAPAVTISVWPSGWVCHAVRAPGSKVTVAPPTRAGASAWNGASMRTLPVKYSAAPTTDGAPPALLTLIGCAASSVVTAAIMETDIAVANGFIAALLHFWSWHCSALAHRDDPGTHDCSIARRPA
ncbi:hypothetical protein XFF6994_1380004 [Xanthomonas citri pv. fuscans]|nr:hypothetical protein XFF6994_1380004 [Xanthomonas citri pv. fuscans]